MDEWKLQCIKIFSEVSQSDIHKKRTCRRHWRKTGLLFMFISMTRTIFDFLRRAVNWSHYNTQC